MKRTNVPLEEQRFDRMTTKAVQILTFLSRHPNDSFSLTEVSKKVGVSKSTAFRILKQFKKAGYVRIGAIANLVWRVAFNRESLHALGFKISQNLMIVYTSGIADFIIQRWGAPRAIILFGSVRKGEDGPGSDIDIAVELSEDIEMDIVTLEQFQDEPAQKLKNTEKQLNRKFKIHFFTRKRVDPNLFRNIANGILLYGFLDVQP